MSRVSPDETAPESPDWATLRSRFPVLSRKTYLNSCAYGAMAADVTAALARYSRDRLEKGTDWHYWIERNDSVRNAAARLVGANTGEIAVTTSASAGINAIASSLDFGGSRNRIVISGYEFPTSGQIWYAQARRGAEILRVEERDGYIPAEAFAEVIDERTLLVGVTRVCFRNGAKLDVKAIAEIAHRHGAMVLVDGYQALGTEAFDVRDADIDFLVGGMLKYLLGTAGIGMLYARESLIPALVPTCTGWFAQADIFAMDNSKNEPAPDARRFEMGTPPVPNCYAAEAGLAIIDDVGLANIEDRVRSLTGMIVERALDAGYSVAAPLAPEQRGAMVTLRSKDEEALVARLDERGIVTSCRAGNLRVSPHFYNDETDVDALFDALADNDALLVRSRH